MLMDSKAKEEAWKFSIGVLNIDEERSKLHRTGREEFLKWYTMSSGGRGIQYVGPFAKLAVKYGPSKANALGLE